MSWTTGPQIAATFARYRAGGDGQVWIADVEPAHMLGALGAEHEYIIDPRGVELTRMSRQALDYMTDRLAAEQPDGFFVKSVAGYWPSKLIEYTRRHSGFLLGVPNEDRLNDLAWRAELHGVDDRPLSGPDREVGWMAELCA